MRRTNPFSRPNRGLGLTAVLLCALYATPVRAHPGSGIVVDSQGRVYFVQTGDPDGRFPGFIWEVDARGTLTPVYRTGAHWLALDENGSFASADLAAYGRNPMGWPPRP